MQHRHWLIFGLLSSSGCTLLAEAALPADDGEGGAGAAVSSGGTTNDGGAHTTCEAPSTCVAPPGIGFFELSRVPATSNTSACANDATPSITFLGPFGAPSCSCECGVPSGGACSPPTLTCHQTPDCSSAAIDATLNYGDACSVVPNSTNMLACLVTAPAVVSVNPTCREAEPIMVPIEAFEERIEACPTTGACQGELACASSSACVAIDGDAECPADFPERLVTFASGDDGRTCPACACSAESSCTGGSYTFHDRDNCADKDPPILIGSACTDVTPLLDNNQGAGSYAAATLNADCIAGGAETGAGYVAPMQPRTYCCPSGGAP